MSLLPITLGVRRNLDAQGNGGKRKSLKKGTLKNLVQQTLERDKHTCRYCGFTSKQYQKAIPKDWAASDLAAGELVTACVFCDQCLALETVGPMASGVLIWLPEISQAALHHLIRAVYAARAHGDKLPEKIRSCAGRAFDVLLHARGEAKRRIGTDEPSVLASVMLENVAEAAYLKRGEKLQGLRLLPLDRRIVANGGGELDQFPRIISYWISPEGPYGAMPPEKWETLNRFAKQGAAG
ncbi:MAG: type IV secretion protein DotN [Proteobacteria bacterium]|nr:type IV secretion protein DotN [Pseudomonadota bacterium]